MQPPVKTVILCTFGDGRRLRLLKGFAVPRTEDESTMSALRALALVGQVGLAVVVPIVAGVFAGLYVERRVGGGGLLLVACILGGLVCGVYAAYRLLAKEIR